VLPPARHGQQDACGKPANGYPEVHSMTKGPTLARYLPIRRTRRAVAVAAGALLAAGVLPGAIATAHAAPAGAAADSGTGSPGAAATAAVAGRVGSPTGRWIVQLAEPSLAEHAPTRGRARLDVASADAAAYTGHLATARRSFADRIRQVAPDAQVVRDYHVVLNGMSVRMSPAEAAAVRRMPGVRGVTPDVSYQLDMFSTPAQIGAPALWNAVGGQANAGAGVKVAIIDSGIFVRTNPDGSYGGNPCFNDAGYPQPPKGFPKGDTRFTNRKVLVARSYFRPGDPPIAGEDTAIQGTNAASSHGTHVAGTVACDAGTQVTFQGAQVTLSGVAPRAYLMNYRVFYPSQSSEDFQNGNAYVTELVAAIEDAVADGADVVSSSWGSSYQSTAAWPDPMVQAAEAATDAGVTMVFANANQGPDEATTAMPASSPKVIGVGAVTKTATITPGDMDVTAPAPVPANLTGMGVGSAQFGPALASFGPLRVVPAQSVATNGSSLGCSLAGDTSPFPAGSVTGALVLIERGTCTFSEKVFNAQRGGALAAVVYNNAANGDSLQSMGAGAHAADVTIPSVFMRRSDGLAMAAYAAANPGTAQAAFTLHPHPVPNPGDVMAGFSSRGPTTDKTLKPDLVAPGVDVVSGGYGTGPYPGPFVGFGAVSGTSMATPHVAGSAALLVQLHPDWTPAQIKSALMNTATEEVFADTNHTVRAGVLDRGAGRIDLTRAGDPGLTLAPPSLSGGEVPAGTAVPFTVSATDVTSTGGTWDISTALSSNAPGNVSVSPAGGTITVKRGHTASFSLQVSAAAGAAPASYSGDVVLTQRGGGRVLHLPLWLRVVPTQSTAQVLLVDDDASSVDSSFADYSAVYRGVLDRLGVSYSYLDIGTGAFPSYNALFGYRTVVVFTGDNDSFDTSGFSLSTHNRLSEWLDSGGRLLAFGQNFAETSDDNTSFASARIGRARLYHGYLGVSEEAPSLYSGAPPAPTAAGEGPFAGTTLDLTGAENSVEATAPLGDTDTFNALSTMTRFFRPLSSTAAPGWGVGFGRSAEPGLAESRLQFRYRSAVLGFGLEGLTADASRDTLTRGLLDWLQDGVAVTGMTATAGAGLRVTLTATAASSGGSIAGYRWDFGDGSAVLSSSTASVTHRYSRPGSYTVRVEATDSLGHRALGSTQVTVP
jgi:subtilisin family serine protease